MITKSDYIKANVKHTIYNQIAKSFFQGINFYQTLFEACYKSEHGGIVSCHEYHQACLDYVNKMRNNDVAIMKFITSKAETFASPSWREERADFGCKNNRDFLKIVKNIIAN